MKTLISAIKAQLQTDLTYVRDSDIYVTEDLLLIPDTVRCPAVAIKDGDIDYTIETQVQETDTLEVTLAAYVELRKPEATIMGDAATGQKGVLDIIADIVAALKNNTLSGQAAVAVPVAETASELLADEKTAIQTKTVTMRYSRYD
jgi:hypothetical protein